MKIRAYIEENSNGRHDIVFGNRFLKQLGLVFNYKTKTVIWDDISIPIKKQGSIDITTLNDDSADEALPTFMQKACN